MQLENTCGVTLPDSPPDIGERLKRVTDEEISNGTASNSTTTDEDSDSSNSTSSDSASDFDGGQAIPFGIVDEILALTGAFDYGMYNCIIIMDTNFGVIVLIR